MVLLTETLWTSQAPVQVTLHELRFEQSTLLPAPTRAVHALVAVQATVLSTPVETVQSPMLRQSYWQWAPHLTWQRLVPAQMGMQASISVQSSRQASALRQGQGSPGRQLWWWSSPQ